MSCPLELTGSIVQTQRVRLSIDVHFDSIVIKYLHRHRSFVRMREIEYETDRWHICRWKIVRGVRHEHACLAYGSRECVRACERNNEEICPLTDRSVADYHTFDRLHRLAHVE